MSNTGAEDMIGSRVDVMIHDANGKRQTLNGGLTLDAVGDAGILVSTDAGNRAFIPWYSVEAILQSSTNNSESSPDDLHSLWGNNED